MIETIEATYDGKVFHPEKSLKLKPNTRVKITIETEGTTENQKASFLRTAKSLKLLGPSDWSENIDHPDSPRETPAFRPGRDSGRRRSPPCGDCFSAAFLGNITTVSYLRPTAGLAGCEVCGEVSDLWGYAVECGTLVKPPPGGMAKTKLGTPMGNLGEAENPDREIGNPRPSGREGCQYLYDNEAKDEK